jgi:hypothetical protein
VKTIFCLLLLTRRRQATEASEKERSVVVNEYK